MTRARGYGLLTGLSAFLLLQQAQAITIPVFCASDPNALGEITVDADGAGISGGFSSLVPVPGPATLAGAAAQCGEDHFNWYQIVAADRAPPPGSTLPYVDVPPGGYPLADIPAGQLQSGVGVAGGLSPSGRQAAGGAGNARAATRHFVGGNTISPGVAPVSRQCSAYSAP
jgi:hypothetical protein